MATCTSATCTSLNVNADAQDWCHEGNQGQEGDDKRGEADKHVATLDLEGYGGAETERETMFEMDGYRVSARGGNVFAQQEARVRVLIERNRMMSIQDVLD